MPVSSHGLCVSNVYRLAVLPSAASDSQVGEAAGDVLIRARHKHPEWEGEGHAGYKLAA